MIHSPGDKKLIIDFQELLEIIASSNPVDKNESAGDKRKRIADLLSCPVKFGYYYFGDYLYSPFSVHHIELMNWVFQNPNNILLAQMFRQFGKSVVFGLIIPLFIKFNGRLTGMMLGSLNEALAAERLADIQANLMSNQRIINDFGPQFSFGNWEDGAFKTKDNIGFYAFGKKQSPRGTRFQWKRPNYGLIDDLNEARYLNNEEIALADKRWVTAEFKPALWTREWWLVVAQNKFHDNAVTSLLEDDVEIETKVFHIKMKNEHGNTNWPENPDFSNEAIAKLERTEGADFIRERMQIPFEEGADFKAEWLNEWVDPLPFNEYDSQIIHYLDPSYKSTEKSDYKFWVLLGKKGLKYDILNAWGQKTTSKNMWEHAFRIDEENEDYSIIQHCMESNFIQEDVHKRDLEMVEEEQGRALRILFDRRDKGDKHARIMTMQSLFQRGYIRFNIHKKADAGMKLLRAQILAFQKGSRINDDGPDALEGAIWMADRNTKRRSGKTRSGKMNKNKARGM
jgi:hypothetical protein